MVIFDLWTESLIFTVIYAALVFVPCFLITLIGKRMIDRLGQFPSQAPAIQLSIFLKLVVIEIISFTCLIGFYHIFVS